MLSAVCVREPFLRCRPVNLSTAAPSLLWECVVVCSYACKNLHSCVCMHHIMYVKALRVCHRQPGLSSLDNQSLALVRQPSEAERSKAKEDDHHSVCMCAEKVTQPLTCKSTMCFVYSFICVCTCVLLSPLHTLPHWQLGKTWHWGKMERGMEER